MTEYGSGSSKDAGWIAAAAAEAGEPMPPVPEPPELPFHLQWVWEGFLVLSGARSSGMAGPNKISIADIKAYLDLLEVDRNSAEFLYYIARLDDKFVEIYMKREKRG